MVILAFDWPFRVEVRESLDGSGLRERLKFGNMVAGVIEPHETESDVRRTSRLEVFSRVKRPESVGSREVRIKGVRIASDATVDKEAR